MTSVLLVEDDPHFSEALARDLREQGLQVHAASDFDGAMQFLAQGRVDVLLTDLRMGQRDGIDLLKAVASMTNGPRPILMSAYATAREHQLATEYGAVEVLCKPFTAVDLRRALEKATETGFQGSSIHGLSIVDMLQMYHLNRRSVSIHVSGAERASVHLKEGEIIHAEVGSKDGERALRIVLGRSSGSIRTAPLSCNRRTIQRSFDALLLDNLRVLDEETGQIRVAPIEGAPSEGLDRDFADLLGKLDDDEEVNNNTPNQERNTTMGAIDDGCKKIVNTVDGAIACGVIDLDTGMVLGISNVAQYSQTLNEIVAAAAVDLFRGKNVSRIEKLVREHRGTPEDGAHYFQDVQITSANTMHFARVLKKGRAAIVLVTNKDTNVGMGWAQLKTVIPDIEPHIP